MLIFNGLQRLYFDAILNYYKITFCKKVLPVVKH